PAPADPTTDKTVFQAGDALPEPIRPEQMPKPTIPLPTGDIRPLLLTKDAGPFMVNAYTFRGENASRYAQALAIELREKFGLPAYVFNPKIQPGHSNIRNVQPTAADYVPNGQITAPEVYRTFDEAAVLVGNAKTIDDSEKILFKVKHIHPISLD